MVLEKTKTSALIRTVAKPTLPLLSGLSFLFTWFNIDSNIQNLYIRCVKIIVSCRCWLQLYTQSHSLETQHIFVWIWMRRCEQVCMYSTKQKLRSNSQTLRSPYTQRFTDGLSLLNPAFLSTFVVPIFTDLFLGSKQRCVSSFVNEVILPHSKKQGKKHTDKTENIYMLQLAKIKCWSVKYFLLQLHAQTMRRPLVKVI